MSQVFVPVNFYMCVQPLKHRPDQDRGTSSSSAGFRTPPARWQYTPAMLHLLPEIVFSYLGITYIELYNTCLRASGSFHSTLRCLTHPYCHVYHGPLFSSLWAILLYEYTIIYCPFYCWWTFVLFSVGNYYEDNRYEYPRISPLVDISSPFCWAYSQE